jgi:hypothetical protein
MNHDKNPAIFFVPKHKAKPSRAKLASPTYLLSDEGEHHHHHHMQLHSSRGKVFLNYHKEGKVVVESSHSKLSSIISVVSVIGCLSVSLSLGLED